MCLELKWKEHYLLTDVVSKSQRVSVELQANELSALIGTNQVVLNIHSFFALKDIQSRIIETICKIKHSIAVCSTESAMKDCMSQRMNELRKISKV